jgi:hypothetical protein
MKEEFNLLREKLIMLKSAKYKRTVICAITAGYKYEAKFRVKFSYRRVKGSWTICSEIYLNGPRLFWIKSFSQY